MDHKHTSQKETGASGAAYEPYVGRWSRQVAREFLTWLSVPAGSHWLDVGCGTGALSQTILGSAAPGRVKGIDRAADYVAFAREQAGLSIGEPAPRFGRGVGAADPRSQHPG